jgi:hypothetical protein
VWKIGRVRVLVEQQLPLGARAPARGSPSCVRSSITCNLVARGGYGRARTRAVRTATGRTGRARTVRDRPGADADGSAGATTSAPGPRTGAAGRPGGAAVSRPRVLGLGEAAGSTRRRRRRRATRVEQPAQPRPAAPAGAAAARRAGGTSGTSRSAPAAGAGQVRVAGDDRLDVLVGSRSSRIPALTYRVSERSRAPWRWPGGSRPRACAARARSGSGRGWRPRRAWRACAATAAPTRAGGGCSRRARRAARSRVVARCGGLGRLIGHRSPSSACRSTVALPGARPRVVLARAPPDGTSRADVPRGAGLRPGGRRPRTGADLDPAGRPPPRTGCGDHVVGTTPSADQRGDGRRRRRAGGAVLGLHRQAVGGEPSWSSQPAAKTPSAPTFATHAGGEQRRLEPSGPTDQPGWARPASRTRCQRSSLPAPRSRPRAGQRGRHRRRAAAVDAHGRGGPSASVEHLEDDPLQGPSGSRRRSRGVPWCCPASANSPCLPEQLWPAGPAPTRGRPR